MNESQAIGRIKQGDLGGLEMLVRIYQVKAVQAAFLIARDRPMAEDVVHAAFLKAVERIDQFNISRAFGPWFLCSVVNAAIDAARQQNRMLSLDRETEGETEALDALSPEQRAAVILRHFLGMSEAEMTRTLQTARLAQSSSGCTQRVIG
jgi:RNA polymerase sigma-70 factor (ECF subfamily)